MPILCVVLLIAKLIVFCKVDVACEYTILLGNYGTVHFPPQIGQAVLHLSRQGTLALFTNELALLHRRHLRYCLSCRGWRVTTSTMSVVDLVPWPKSRSNNRVSCSSCVSSSCGVLASTVSSKSLIVCMHCWNLATSTAVLATQFATEKTNPCTRFVSNKSYLGLLSCA